MGTEKRYVRTSLRGYGCQHFPSPLILEKLTETYVNFGLDDKIAEAIGWLATETGFRGLGKPKTGDGYHWAYGLKFETEKDGFIGSVPIIGRKYKIMVLFPQTGDDRHITFFTDGDATGKDVNKLAESLYKSFNQISRE